MLDAVNFVVPKGSRWFTSMRVGGVSCVSYVERPINRISLKRTRKNREFFIFMGSVMGTLPCGLTNCDMARLRDVTLCMDTSVICHLKAKDEIVDSYYGVKGCRGRCYVDVRSVFCRRIMYESH